MEFIKALSLSFLMTIELCIKDTRSLTERLAIEARAAMQAGLPKGLDVNPKLIEQANGYSSRYEMLNQFKDLGVEYWRTADSEYVRVPEGALDTVKTLITKTGYAINSNT